MSFNYIQRSKRPLSAGTLDLLEEIDKFQHKVLKPDYNSLGELHDEITVEVVDYIPPRLKLIKTTVGDLRKQLEDMKKYNEEVREHNHPGVETVINHTIEGVRERESRCGYDDIVRKDSIETKDIEDVLENCKDMPDDAEMPYMVKVKFSGYYFRDVNNKGRIVLEYSTDKERLSATYIHEMMHSFYDSDKSKPMEYVEYVEEPLAEYGMLHFLYSLYDGNKDYEVLLKKSYYDVERKQHIAGLTHYGFGAYLFFWDTHIKWERLLRDKHPRKIDGKTYSFIEESLSGGSLDNDRLCFIANKMYGYLMNMASKKTNPSITQGQVIIKYQNTWLVRIKADLRRDVNIGSIIRLYQLHRGYLTVSIDGRGLADLYSKTILSLYYSSILKKLNLDVVYMRVLRYVYKERKNVCELEVCIDRDIVNMVRIVPDETTAVHFIDLIKFYRMDDGRSDYMDVVIDKEYKKLHYIANNNVIVDNNNRVVFGYGNSIIPEGTKVIDEYAFKGCRELSSLVIPVGVRSIGRYAFAFCTGLKSIEIPSSVKYVDKYTFKGCENLQSVVIKGKNVVVKMSAFEGCSRLHSRYDIIGDIIWDYN